MAEQVEVKIITADAVQNLAELRKAISDAKGQLEGMDIAGPKYQEQLEEITKMQSLLKNALYATTGDFEGLKKASEGVGTSYNALVKHMADLKREFRATEDAARRMELASQIKEINDQLKEMDASQGNFQRNVGNYASALKGLPPTLGKIRKEAGDIGETLNIMGKQPILGLIGLLAPLIMKIAEGLKDNEKALAGIDKLMESLKPVTDFLAGLLDKIADVLFVVIDEVSKFLGNSGLLNKIIQGVMGVGNAILNFVIAPFKGIAAAIKVFKEEGVKGLGNAAKAFGAEMKSGVAFKENFAAGQAVADTMLSGMASRKKKAQDTGKAIGKEVKKELLKALDVDQILAEMDKRAQRAEQRKKEMADLLDPFVEGYIAEQEAEVQAYFDMLDEEDAYEQAMAEHRKQRLDNMLAGLSAFASGTVDLLGSIADAYESNGELSEQEEKRVKNLRIAAATISMLQGAVTAYASAQSLGVPMGPIVGAINAAAVVATGIANIAKIKATNVSRDSAPSTAAPTVATVQAPALQTAVPTTTVVNGARTEAALNNAARPQKVYLVESEQQAMGTHVQIVEDETSF